MSEETLARFRQAREKVKATVSVEAYASATLQRQGNTYVCPACGSGTGPHKTSAFNIDGSTGRWKCFSCGNGGDVLDLAGIVNHTDDNNEQVEAVAALAGLDFKSLLCGDESMPKVPRAAEAWATFASGETAMAAPPKAEKPAEPEKDYSAGRAREAEKIVACRKAMTPECAGWSYCIERGFTPENISEFGLGWDASHKRVVIPWSARDGEWYHIDRDVTGRQPHKYDKPRKDDVGAQPLNNPQAFNDPCNCVMVVEGMIDALALRTVGANVICLGGVGWKAVVEEAKARNYQGVIIDALDIDGTGRKMGRELVEMARDKGLMAMTARFKHVPIDFDGGQFGFKDAGDLLVSDPQALESYWLENKQKVAEGLEKKRRAAYEETLKKMHVVHPFFVAGDIYACADSEEPVSTGLECIDRALGGGLHRGVYTLGAGSSTGKTTLVLQMADYIARHGRKVLFVTIEQSAKELVAKSLTRTMCEMGERDKGVTVREMTNAKQREAWGPQKNKAFLEACERYAGTVDRNLCILEPVNQPSVADIRTAAQAMTDYDGVTPLVFVDYLQLLAAPSDRDDERRATNKNVMELRQMARDLKTTVFVISALNRASYNDVITMASFRESSAIEYGSDVLIGLQPGLMTSRLAATDDKTRALVAKTLVDNNKRIPVRPIELTVLKARGDALPDYPVQLIFDAPMSMFKENPSPAKKNAGNGSADPHRPR
jgi:replicative DNA helicase